MVNLMVAGVQFAISALLAYHENDVHYGKYQNLLDSSGWERDDTMSSSDLKVATYVNQGARVAVVAFRGTSDVSDFGLDLALVSSSPADRPRFAQSLSFVETAVLLQLPRNYRVIVVGHSLGGALAAFVASRHGLEGHAFNGFCPPPLLKDARQCGCYGSLTLHMVRGDILAPGCKDLPLADKVWYSAKQTSRHSLLNFLLSPTTASSQSQDNLDAFLDAPLGADEQETLDDLSDDFNQLLMQCPAGRKGCSSTGGQAAAGTVLSVVMDGPPTSGADNTDATDGTGDSTPIIQYTAMTPVASMAPPNTAEPEPAAAPAALLAPVEGQDEPPLPADSNTEATAPFHLQQGHDQLPTQLGTTSQLYSHSSGDSQLLSGPGVVAPPAEAAQAAPTASPTAQLGYTESTTTATTTSSPTPPPKVTIVVTSQATLCFGTMSYPDVSRTPETLSSFQQQLCNQLLAPLEAKHNMTGAAYNCSTSNVTAGSVIVDLTINSTAAANSSDATGAAASTPQGPMPISSLLQSHVADLMAAVSSGDVLDSSFKASFNIRAPPSVQQLQHTTSTVQSIMAQPQSPAADQPDNTVHKPQGATVVAAAVGAAAAAAVVVAGLAVWWWRRRQSHYRAAAYATSCLRHPAGLSGW